MQNTKRENMQKEQQNKKITFAPAISTSYLFIFIATKLPPRTTYNLFLLRQQPPQITSHLFILRQNILPEPSENILNTHDRTDTRGMQFDFFESCTVY